MKQLAILFWLLSSACALAQVTNLTPAKQNAITTSSALTAGSMTLANRPALGDSSGSVPTTGSVRADIERSLSKLKVNRDSIRALFSVTGTGLTYDPTTGKFTATGGSSSNVTTGTDPQNTSVQALFISSPGDRIYLGTAAKRVYGVDFLNADNLLNVPPFKIKSNNMGFGIDADATVTRFNYVVSINASSDGTGTNNGLTIYGAKTFRRIKEDDGTTAPVLARFTTDKQLGIGTETPTANLDVVGNVKASSDVEITDATKGYILKDSSGARWRLTISTTGSITSTKL